MLAVVACQLEGREVFGRMVRAFSAFLIRHGSAKKRPEEAAKRHVQGVEEEAALRRCHKMRFLSTGPCDLAVFENVVTRSGAFVPENVQKPQRLCTKVGGLTPIGPRWGNGRRTISEASSGGPGPWAGTTGEID